VDLGGSAVRNRVADRQPVGGRRGELPERWHVLGPV